MFLPISRGENSVDKRILSHFAGIAVPAGRCWFLDENPLMSVKKAVAKKPTPKAKDLKPRKIAKAGGWDQKKIKV